ncbi:MAG: trigger factor, partial [Lactobacillaceae bacterium]|nr:trigger factor [Lactobacillaceae bacterium]
GFEDQLVGHKAGEDVNVNVTFPEQYQAEDLAGKDALFEVKIHEVKKLELPAIDDEFAKDVDDQVASLEELKTKIKDRLQTQKSEVAKDEFETNAIQAAVDNAKLDTENLPQDLIEEDVNRQMGNFFNNLQSQGIAPDMYFQLTGQTEHDLHEQFEKDSPNRVKTTLVLQAIADAENFDITDADIDIEYARLATAYGMELEKLEDVITPSMVSHDLKLQRAVKVITDNAKTK